eukprot:TRINITY_DN89851_c0_g1_i1.p1 TRINITY_DN89851_c0_g1~~TRINITY_DN89851_c0_g1_i1.p1  ORF type:complete len:493 (+),score=55.06 TRINITY_DN89851_c0_g1_i1:100-1578(+)
MPVLAALGQKAQKEKDTAGHDTHGSGELSSDSGTDGTESWHSDDEMRARTEEKNEKNKDYKQKIITLELQKKVANNLVVVPLTPAPPQSPGRIKKTIPLDFTVEQPKSVFERTLQSSIGRSVTMLLSTMNFWLIVLGVVSWNAPALWVSNEALPILGGTILLGVVLYTAIPALAKVAGLETPITGVEWKPYLVFYRLSFFFSVPALFFFHLGPGARVSFGEGQGGIEDISLGQLERGSQKFFRASDGFVALNLTKGITETLSPTNHSDAVPRVSRFRDAQIVNNREPYSYEVEPTVPPGFQENYRIAPVFAQWAPCVTRYRISAGCLKQNAVIGWAFATSRSLCTNLRMVACRPQSPQLNPVYKCATDPIVGKDYKQPIQGLCGRSVTPPLDEVIDELKAVLLLDGWPEETMPNATHGWYDVWPDKCISDQVTCESSWSMYENIALAFGGLTSLMAIVPVFIDCYIDAKIRAAQSFSEACRIKSKPGTKHVF